MNIRKTPFYPFLLFFFPLSCFSQEYSYTHYDVTEGLAASTVYCITQDHDGFIWMGTEMGVSRFDGVHFRNFTVKDGLPDLEILQIFGDSRGRVWMAPFRKAICYYYKGKIYNQQNDSLLGKISLKENIRGFAEDAQGNILIQEKTALWWVAVNGALKKIDSVKGRPIRNCAGIGLSASGNFWVQEDSAVFKLSDTGFSYFTSISYNGDIVTNANFISFSPNWMVWADHKHSSCIRSLSDGHSFHRRIDTAAYKHNSYSIMEDSLVYFNETVGATEINAHTGEKKLFLPGKVVSRSFRDRSGSLWFTTLGQGIFRLNSDEIRTIKVPSDDGRQTSVHAITKIRNNLFVGHNHNLLYRLSLPDHVIRATDFGMNSKSDILFVREAGKEEIFAASDGGMMKFDRGLHPLIERSISIKSAFQKTSDEVLFATATGAFLFRMSDFRFIDTLWRERCTTVYASGDTVYLGTLNGLYRINPDKSVVFLGEKIPFLRKRISAIVESPGHILWASSYDDAGIIGIQHDRVVATLSKQQGLTSDICRTLLMHDNTLWVGTDKGLNEIALDKPGYPVIQYTSADGLASNIINCIYIDSSMAYIGTDAGLSYFNRFRIKTAEECHLYLLAALNGVEDRLPDSAQLQLKYNKSDLRLEFAAISYRSASNIVYRYRMLGLDSSWKETGEAFLDYPSLPSGNYIFQLQAVNRFGVRSRLLSLPFTVTTPYWRTIWFTGLLIGIFLLLTWFFVSWRIRGIRRRQEERELLSKRMLETEQMALRAQMNPHFIFNCLNSIQQYIFDQDIFAANKYITGFARLIRATLQHSTVSYITLDDEIAFLSTYLSLEKLRFKDKMDYFIEVDLSLNRSGIFIPPMLIQPYVENSMRHGLRHKTDGKGYIRIAVKLVESSLFFIIEDNGIGREQAARYKTREHIEYQSRGMSLTADRVRLINSTYKDSIRILVEDLKDDQGKAAGTKVVMEFKNFYHAIPVKNTI